MERPGLPAREDKSVEAVVENAVDAWFADHSEEIAASIRTKLEDIQIGILEKLCKTIQKRYVQRIQALEASTRRNEAMLREIQVYTRRADDDLRRLADAVSGLIEEKTQIQSASR